MPGEVAERDPEPAEDKPGTVLHSVCDGPGDQGCGDHGEGDLESDVDDDRKAIGDSELKAIRTVCEHSVECPLFEWVPEYSADGLVRVRH